MGPDCGEKEGEGGAFPLPSPNFPNPEDVNGI